MSITYETELKQTGNNTGIPVPDEVLTQLGGGRKPRVVVDASGYELRTSLGSMGGAAMVSFSKAHREASGFVGGQPLTVTLRLDDAPVELQVPADLAAAMASEAAAQSFFDSLAPSYRKAYVTNVESAKTDATRERRIAATVEKLLAHRKS